MRSFFYTVLRFRVLFIISVVLMTVFLALQIKNLKIVINPTTMLPQHHPNVIGTNTAEELFGSKHVVVIGVSAANGETALTPEVLTVIEALSDELPKIEGVKGHTLMSLVANKAKAISGKAEEMVIEPMLEAPFTQESIDSLENRIAANPIYQGTLVSADRRVVSVSFAISAGDGGFRQIMDQVQAVIEAQRSTGVTITASGTPIFFAQVERFAQRMGILFPIALIIIGLIHFEAFRSIQGLVLPLVTALLAVVWGLGIMGLARVPMDAFNATTPILILAVAAGHAVQILKRYYEEYDRQRTQFPDLPPKEVNQTAVIESLTKVAPVMMTACGVAIVGFFSLITFDIATIRTFGMFTGLGILSALLIEMTFIPALRSILPPPKTRSSEALHNIPSKWDRLADSFSDLVLIHYKRVLLVFGVIALGGLAAAVNINQENSTKSYFAENISVRQDDAFLNSHLAGTNTLYVVFKSSRVDQMKEPEALQLIEQTQRYIEEMDGVGKTVSLVDFIKQMNQSLNDGKPEFRQLPSTSELISQYLFLYSLSADPVDFDSYVDYDYQNANLIVWMKNDSSKFSQATVEQIRTFLAPKLASTGIDILIGGSVPQSSALSETLVEGKIRNILQMMAVVFVVGIVIFRSFLAGVCLVIPLAITVLINFGVMGLTGIPLNTPNAVSSAMAIGIGADYAIYLLYRMREELRGHDDYDRALRSTMRTAGKAIVYVATAIAGGYSVLMLSKGFYVHIWFGVLIVTSMLISAIAALLVVPSLLKWFPLNFLRNTSSEPAKAATATFPCLALALMFAFLTPNDSYAAELSAQDVMEKNYQVTRVINSVSNATFTLTNNKGQQRVRQTFGVTALESDGAINKRVIRFLSPNDVRNTTTLLVENLGGEDEIWVYLPAMKKSRRISSDNKKSSFVGTDLSYGDILGHKPQEWIHTLVSQTDTQYVVDSLPKTAEVGKKAGYSKRTTWVNKTHFVADKMEFYDLSSKHLKTVLNTNIQNVDSANQKWQPMNVAVTNHQTGHSTQVIMESYKANTDDAKESYFSKRYLEKEE
ncbi:MMPL family transporter [Cellvibrio sp. OA-2007]|uniref:MMPL family transporter n=1 Tax=Cellvibrio sp. OA-2007 TaxID=529823 RepID=UPI0007823AB8|nr:MMPL family transporter [Cellvibrio sp. OA-2007]